jgi:hypothetical protein
MTAKGFGNVWSRFCDQISTRVDQCTSALLHAEKLQMARKPHATKLSKTRLSSPEDEVKKLVITASSLDDVWQFFLKRLKSGSTLDLLCFSVLDERGLLIEARFLHDGLQPERTITDTAVISITDTGNHLVQSYRRKDTTFSPNIRSLGSEVLALLPWATVDSPDAPTEFNLFSVPLIAGGQAIAMITLGFREMDSFSQAKLSYVYTLRDQSPSSPGI